MLCSFWKLLLVPLKKFGVEESKIPNKNQFCQTGVILKGEDGELCEDHLLTPGLKFPCGFFLPGLNGCKRGRACSFSEEDEQHFKFLLHTDDSLYQNGSLP